MPAGVYIRTAEHNRRISESHIGAKNPMYGKKRTEEAKRKTSESLKGRKRPPFSDEWKAKLGTPGKKRHSEEWKAQLRERQLGDKSQFWIDGRTSEYTKIRNSAATVDWRVAVYERDNWSCVKCGDSTGGNLNAHHIFNFSTHKELRFSLDNGITFCAKCHVIFHKRYGVKKNTKDQVVEFLASTLDKA